MSLPSRKRCIATGIPDSDNGRFEQSGLGHEFLQLASLRRKLAFEAPKAGCPTCNPSIVAASTKVTKLREGAPFKSKNN